MPVKGNVKADDIGKIFVGGLAAATDKEKLQGYFANFGPVTDCVLMVDNNTKQSRGFGFVTFRDPDTVNKVVQEKEHHLDGKRIDPKPAVPRGTGQAVPAQTKVNSNEFKVFIGGLAHNTTEEDIKQYFIKFTNCVGVQLILDKTTQKPRGFGFVTFQTKEDVDKAVEAHFHQINGKMVEVKRAEHKPNQAKSSFGGQGNPLATPPVHSMQGAMGRGQYGPQAYMQGGYGQQAGGMQGLGRGGYNAAAYGGYGAVGTGANFGYGTPQTQGYGAAGMPMGGATAGAGGYSQSGYGANPQMSGYAVGAGREPAAAVYGTPGYAGSYPTPGAMAPGAPPAGAPDYGQGMPDSSSPLSGPGSGMPPHGEAAGGGDYTGSYSAYGLGSYQQQDSQYGPARGSFGGESSYSAYPAGESYGAGGSAGGGGGYGSGGSGAESFGRGAGGATRGFHPYGR